MAEPLQYVSPEYQAQLDTLADHLMADRRAKLGELSIYEQEQVALAEVVAFNPVGMGGELALERTVTEAMAFNDARRHGRSA